MLILGCSNSSAHSLNYIYAGSGTRIGTQGHSEQKKHDGCTTVVLGREILNHIVLCSTLCLGESINQTNLVSTLNLTLPISTACFMVIDPALLLPSEVAMAARLCGCKFDLQLSGR